MAYKYPNLGDVKSSLNIDSPKQLIPLGLSFFGTWLVYYAWYLILLSGPDFPSEITPTFVALWWAANLTFIVCSLASIFYALLKTFRKQILDKDLSNGLVLASASSVFLVCMVFYWARFLPMLWFGDSFNSAFKNFTVFTLLGLATVFVFQLFLSSIACSIALTIIKKTEVENTVS